MTKIYVAGPMTGLRDFNYPAFHEAQDMLEESGWEVVSPAADERGEKVDPPTKDEALPHDHYLRVGLRKLLECDEIYLLPGWSTSKGAVLEQSIAEALGMGINFHNLSVPCRPAPTHN